MQKILLPSLALVVLVLTAFTFQSPAPEPMKWYTWEEAVALNKTKPKKIMVDVYTNWCGWCKRMDKGAFSDPAVMAYLSQHFYPVKLNAEQRETIKFNGENFEFVANDNGRGGVHTLAYALLDGKMSYPSLVYLNEKYERIMISPGYKETPDLLKELSFAAEEQYNKTTWEKYRDGK
ncbi:MAG: DUF255 domain-containing protein [Chitinophagales bacterium]|nr:DUF255 domain-containing protein [Chitinophagales bacterium]